MDKKKGLKEPQNKIESKYPHIGILNMLKK